jgi:hypothetical protein
VAGRRGAYQLVAAVAEDVEIGARQARIGQYRQQEFGRAGIGHASCLRHQGVQAQACGSILHLARGGRRFAGDGGASQLGQRGQRHTKVAALQQYAFVGIPGIIRQQRPFGRRQRPRALQRGGHRFAGGVAGKAGSHQGFAKQFTIEFARQARDFAAIRTIHHHRRIAAQFQARRHGLRVRAIAIELDGHHALQLAGEAFTAEDFVLHTVARRAPHGAPVQEQWTARNAGGFQCGVEATFEPLDSVSHA